MRVSVVVGLLVAVTALLMVVTAQEVDRHTFRPPFQDFDANFGNRKLPKWMIGGSAVLNENFLRLTPDRAVRCLVMSSWHRNQSEPLHV